MIAHWVIIALANGKDVMISSGVASERDPQEKNRPLFVCGKHRFDFNKRTYVMGIVNVTPDSFSDGGTFMNPTAALDHAKRIVDEGADIIDVGGESTRPGAEPVSLEEERKRVLPLIEQLVHQVDVPVSIDTTKVAIAESALKAGALMINDISSFRFEPEMAHLAAEHKVPVVLMHMRGTPRTMQHQAVGENPIAEIFDFLKERITYAEAAGIDPQQIIIDPGIGFGKSLPDGNLSIIKNLSAFKTLGKPILVGLSRKAFIGHVLNLGVGEREEGTAAALAVAVNNGARIVRVHDVRTMKRVVAMVDAIVAVN
jgi:dihydropteroate synthase